MPESTCELCLRSVPRLTRHHLIPRSRHRSKAVLKQWSREELTHRIALLCPPCHKQIHALIDEKTLAAHYHSIEQLHTHPELARFITWVAQRPGNCQITVHRPRN